MMALSYYLLKVVLCSGILFFYYQIALRNKLFHQWNRFYLLIAVVVSLFIPSLHFTLWHHTNHSKAIQLLQVVNGADEYVAEASGKSTISFEQGTYYLYVAVSFVLLLALILSIIKVAALIKSNTSQRINNITFINTEVKGTPFSFFNFIFWNKQIDLGSATGSLIFKHELVHVKEHHTLDKLLMQIVLIFFWCNPFFWLIRSELIMIHEFIADKKAVDQQDTDVFATMIMQTVYPQQYQHIINPFFQSSIKRRLIMFTKKQNPRFTYLNRILVLPLLAVIGLAFTLKTKNISGNFYSSLNKKVTIIIDAGHGGSDNGATSNGLYEKDLTLAIAKRIKELNTNDKINIVLTRDNDVLPDLKDRVKMAADQKADLFISIHVNAASLVQDNQSSGNPTHAMEIIVPISGPYQMQSEVLGSAIVQELSSVYAVNKELKQRMTGVWVIDHNVCPAVLVECGYLTDKKDRQFITENENQNIIATKILASIDAYFTAGKTTNLTRSQNNKQDTTIPKQYYKGKEIQQLEVKEKTQQVEITYADGSKEMMPVKEAKKQKLLVPPPPPPPPPAPVISEMKEQIEKPEKPEKPEQPEKAEKPEKPEQPERVKKEDSGITEKIISLVNKHSTTVSKKQLAIIEKLSN